MADDQQEHRDPAPPIITTEPAEPIPAADTHHQLQDLKQQQQHQQQKGDGGDNNDNEDGRAWSERPAFIPLEANPELMTSLLRKLGLSPALAVHDVYSLTEPDLLAFIPRPALALLLVFPVSATYESARMAEDTGLPVYEGTGQKGEEGEEEVLWFRQTIRNACGLMGLLHAVGNGAARGYVGTFLLLLIVFFFFFLIACFLLFLLACSPSPPFTYPRPRLFFLPYQNKQNRIEIRNIRANRP